jgi:hypothetical protein
MARRILVNGNIELMSPSAKNGKFTLAEMQKAVDGYIEFIYLPKGRIMVVNEEGLLKDMDPNMRAMLIYRQATGCDANIVGNIMLCEGNEVE